MTRRQPVWRRFGNCAAAQPMLLNRANQAGTNQGPVRQDRRCVRRRDGIRFNKVAGSFIVGWHAAARGRFRPGSFTQIPPFPRFASVLRFSIPMKPSRARNTKARPGLRAPIPGMDTRDAAGRTDWPRTRSSDNRPGDRGQRNRENSVRDRNLGGIDSSGRRVAKARTGQPKRDLRAAQPEVANPRKAHRTSVTRATTSRELHRRRKQIRRLEEPPRRNKPTNRRAQTKQT